MNKIYHKKSRVEHWAEHLEQARTVGGLLGDALRRDPAGVALPADFLSESAEVQAEVLYRVIYRGYLTREQRQIEKLKDIEKVRLPDSLDYLAVPGLRRESALKLQQFRPVTLGQASRISGVNPADISVLLVLLESRRRA